MIYWFWLSPISSTVYCSFAEEGVTLGNGRLEGGRHYLESSHFWCAFAPGGCCAIAPEHFWWTFAPDLPNHTRVAESQIHTDSGLVSALDREVHLHLMDVEIGEPNHTDLNFFFLVTFRVVRICLFRAGIVGSSLLSRLIMFTMHQLGIELFTSLCVIVTRKMLTWSTRARYLCQDDQRQKTSICLRSIKSPDDISFWKSGTLSKALFNPH